jgi:uncharacterized protein YbjT (DUF2867 family)
MTEPSSKTTLFITTPTGNVGLETLRALAKRPDRSLLRVIAALRDMDRNRSLLTPFVDEFVRFDFADASGFDLALVGVDKVLLVRPPQLADVDTYFKPFIESMKRVGVKQVVFLSLQGVETNPLTPHHKIEKLITRLSVPYTFLRPSFFMQNLSTTHQQEIRERNEIYIPAGNGRTSLIDVVDIGEVAAMTLATNEHTGKAYELTGSQALTYYEMADILTEVLGRTITYKAPSIPAFIYRQWVKAKQPLGFTLVMVALYTVARLGKAAQLTPVFEQLTGHSPRTFRQFAEANKAVWQSGAS